MIIHFFYFIAPENLFFFKGWKCEREWLSLTIVMTIGFARQRSETARVQGAHDLRAYCERAARGRDGVLSQLRRSSIPCGAGTGRSSEAARQLQE